VILPRQSEGLYLLQRIRDEAHRFAITFHRQRRSKRMITSELDGIPGLGEVRRKALLRRFGSLKKLAAASADEIAEVPGIGPRTAEAIVSALAPGSGGGPPSGGPPGGGPPSGGPPGGGPPGGGSAGQAEQGRAPGPPSEAEPA
jgi:excinuclease ABC subunit C